MRQYLHDATSTIRRSFTGLVITIRTSALSRHHQEERPTLRVLAGRGNRYPCPKNRASHQKAHLNNFTTTPSQPHPVTVNLVSSTGEPFRRAPAVHRPRYSVSLQLQRRSSSTLRDEISSIVYENVQNFTNRHCGSSMLCLGLDILSQRGGKEYSEQCLTRSPSPPASNKQEHYMPYNVNFDLENFRGMCRQQAPAVFPGAP